MLQAFTKIQYVNFFLNVLPVFSVAIHFDFRLISFFFCLCTLYLILCTQPGGE